jgi:hypothetical protein
MSGYVSIDRKILKWEWYQDSKMVHVFLHLLLNANHQQASWRGIKIQRGQYLTGRLKLAAALSLTEMEIRTCLNKLKSTNEIAIHTTNKYSIITICKYDTYQKKEKVTNQRNNQQPNQPTTSEQPTNNQRTTTNNNDNNVNKKNNENKEKRKGFKFSEDFEYVFFKEGDSQRLGTEQKELARIGGILPLLIIEGSIY